MLCLAVLGAVHVIGQDEAQAWNIAQASMLPWDVLHHGETEGHTPLWHFLLWLVHDLPVQVTSFISAVLALVFAFVFIRDKPFPMWVCTVVLFGYFTFYDYPSIPRPYIIALACTALIASALYRGSTNVLYLGSLLSLTAFSSAFGVLLSGTLGILILSCLRNGGWGPVVNLRVIYSVAIFALTVVAAIYFIVFPLDTYEYAQRVLTGEVAGRSSWAETVFASTFPHYRQLPFGLGDFLSDTEFGGVLLHVVSAVVVLSGARLLYSRQTGLFVWVFAVITITAGSYYSGTVTTRHFGHLFIAALAIFWSTASVHDSSEQSNATLSFSTQILAKIVLAGVIFYHLTVGVAGFATAITKPLTAGNAMSSYVEQHLEKPYKLITNNTHDIGHLMAYLDIEVYDTVCDCWRRRADMSRSRKWSPTVLFDQWCRIYSREGISDGLIATEKEMPQDPRFVKVKVFERGVRDNAAGPFQFWKMTQAGIASCREG